MFACFKRFRTALKAVAAATDKHALHAVLQTMADPTGRAASAPMLALIAAGKGLGIAGWLAASVGLNANSGSRSRMVVASRRATTKRSSGIARPLIKATPTRRTSSALAYECGRGALQDYTQAWRWYELSAWHGDAWGQRNLARLLRDGNGFGVDPVSAHARLNLARTNQEQHPDAAKERDALAKRIPAAQLADAQCLAREWSVGKPLGSPRVKATVSKSSKWSDRPAGGLRRRQRRLRRLRAVLVGWDVTAGADPAKLRPTLNQRPMKRPPGRQPRSLK